MEVNNLYLELGGNQYFLCAFDEGKHLNYGGFEGDVTIESFTKAALGKIAIRFGIPLEKMSS